MITPELPDDLSEVISHLEAAYPEEGCGLILRDREGAFRVRPMVNAYDRYHQKDPLHFPRTSRTAFLFDPKEQRAVWDEVDQRGDLIVCIFHSHVDAGAYFSNEDKEMAAPGGVPMMPETCHLVVSVQRGKFVEARLFRWADGAFQKTLWTPGSRAGAGISRPA